MTEEARTNRLEDRGAAGGAGGVSPAGGGGPSPPGGEGPAAGGGAPDGGPAGPRRLLRSRDDRVLAGVAGGVARYFGIDPIIIRIAFAALVVFGGIGVFLYLAGLLFVPLEGAPGEPPAAPIAGRGRLPTAIGAGVLAIAALAAIGQVFWYPGPLVVVAVTAIALYALLRTEDGAYPSAGRVAARIAIGVGLLLVSAAGFVLSGWASAMGYGAWVAGLVVLLGLGLVAGALTRRRQARWLVLPALVLAVPLGIVAAADIDLRGGFGERTYRPASAAEVPPGYRLGAGRMEIDLRGVDFGRAQRRLDVSLGMGEAVVIVPRNVCVATEANVGAGMARALDRGEGGVDVHLREQPAAPAGVPRLTIAGDLGMGALQVVDDPREVEDHRGPGGRHDRGEGFGDRGFDRDEDGFGPRGGPPWEDIGPERPTNTACRPTVADRPGGDR
jgi:phage shock protein PspC (stress-responsive transcriptional regulator)